MHLSAPPRSRLPRLRGLLLALCASAGIACAAPPFDGTAFIDPDIVTEATPTTFTSLSFAGMGVRTMFDRRIDAFVDYTVYLFDASYSGMPAPVEYQVNAEFGGQAAAQAVAASYAPIVGRMPHVLRTRLEKVWMHRGDQPFGGGNDSLLIHTGEGTGTGLYADYYLAHSVIEEVILHELAHTSLDPDHAQAPGWLAAQQADPEFISAYARDNPTREDVAETFGPWLAVRCTRAALVPAVAQIIETTVPNRLAYLDAQGFDVSPVPCGGGVFEDGFEENRATGESFIADGKTRRVFP